MQQGLFIRICVLFVASAFSFSADINAQNSSLQRTNLLKEIVFKGNHIQFNFSVLSTFKARLSKTTGDYPADASAVPGLVLAFKYVVNFNNYYSLLTGPEATIAGRNIIVSFYKNDFYPPLIKDYHFKGI